MAPSIDPALLKELRSAGDDGLVQAAVVLASPAPTHTARTEEPEKQLIERVSRETGDAPVAVTNLPNLGVIIVRASARFVRSLLDQEQVVSASATSSPPAQPEDRSGG